MSMNIYNFCLILFKFVLPVTHSRTLHYILHSECATVQLQQSREVQTGLGLKHELFAMLFHVSSTIFVQTLTN